VALHLIIDGYNLIRTTDLVQAEAEEGLAAGRDRLLTELAAYRRLRRHQITVVFDGAAPLRAQTSREHGLKVVYTPVGRTADQHIIKLVEASRDQVVVVSSDAELCRSAEARGAEIILSPEFRQRLALAKLTEIGAESDDQERPSKPGKGPSRRLPKRLRRRTRRLDKL